MTNSISNTPFVPDVALTIAIWTSVIVAPLLLVIGTVLVYKGYSSLRVILTFIFLGFVLIVFNVMRPSEFDLNKSGIALKTGVSEPKAIETIVKALMDPSIESTNKSITVINKNLAEQDQRINSLSVSSKQTETQIKTIPIPKVQLPSDQGGRTILVFYRDNRKAADDIVAALRANGFKSATSNSNLNEIQKLVNNGDAKSITIAINGSNDDLLDKLKTIVSSATSMPLNKIDAEDKWTFKASDGQVYIF